MSPRALRWRLASSVGAALLCAALAGRAHGKSPDLPGQAAKKSPITMSGRLFVRETVAKEGDDDLDAATSLASARLGLRYQHKELRARIELEVRKSARLRAAYLELDLGPGRELQAGLFKLPLSPLEFTSAWKLPMADRGLLSTVLRDRLQVAGRRVGAALRWRAGARHCPWWRRPELEAGYWQGQNDTEDPLAVGADAGFGKVGSARVTLGPLGASAQVRAGTPALLTPVRHAWASALDVTLEHGGLRLWGEAMLGSSWLVADPTREQALFVEARAVVAWRAGGAVEGAPYLEPYVLVGGVDPDTRLTDDLVLEATSGLNAGRWQRWRLQLEFQLWRIGANAPRGIVDAAAPPRDHTALLLQLAAAFGKH